MATSTYPKISGACEVTDLISYCHANVKYEDHDSILRASDHLSALANDREILISAINSSIMQKVESTGDIVALSSHSILLHADPRFRVRANIWKPPVLRAGTAEYDNAIFSYQYPHNHNFHLLTVGYLGSGYSTEIHECKPHEIAGYVGEKVELRHLEVTSLPRGKVMFYRAEEDVHTQLPPHEFSVSLNLMVVDPEVPTPDQYEFDVEESRIRKVISGPMFPQLTLMTYAVLLREVGAIDSLLRIGFSKAHWRGRKAALEGVAILDKGRQHEIWMRAARDTDPMIKEVGVSNLLEST